MNGGAATIMFGAPSGLSSIAPRQVWTQDSLFVPDKAEDGDFFGAALTAADFNADGYYDLAIGSPYETEEQIFGDEHGSGLVHVLYGGGSGLRVSGRAGWHQDDVDPDFKREEDDNFGEP